MKDNIKSDTRQARAAGALLGGILIHPVLFGLAFLAGAILGHGRLVNSNGFGPPEYGFEGAENAVGYLSLFYVFSFIGLKLDWILVLIGLTAFGAWLGAFIFAKLSTSIQSYNLYLSSRIRRLPISRGSEQGLWNVVLACFLFVVGSQLISTTLIYSTMGWVGIMAGILLFLVGASCLVIAWRTK